MRPRRRARRRDRQGARARGRAAEIQSPRVALMPERGGHRRRPDLFFAVGRRWPFRRRADPRSARGRPVARGRLLRGGGPRGAAVFFGSMRCCFGAATSDEPSLKSGASLRAGWSSRRGPACRSRSAGCGRAWMTRTEPCFAERPPRPRAPHPARPAPSVTTTAHLAPTGSAPRPPRPPECPAIERTAASTSPSETFTPPVTITSSGRPVTLSTPSSTRRGPRCGIPACGHRPRYEARVRARAGHRGSPRRASARPSSTSAVGDAHQRVGPSGTPSVTQPPQAPPRSRRCG